MHEAIQNCQFIKDEKTGGDLLIFTYVANDTTSVSAQYKLAYPSDEMGMTEGLLNIIKSALVDEIILADGDMAGRRLVDIMPKENFDSIVQELGNVIEKCYFAKVLTANKFARTIYDNKIYVTVPCTYSSKITFLYKGYISDGRHNVVSDLLLGNNLDFIGIYCGSTIYSNDIFDEFSAGDYYVKFMTLRQLEEKMSADVHCRLMKKINGNSSNLPFQTLSEGAQRELYELRNYKNIARLNYLTDIKTDPKYYIKELSSSYQSNHIFLTPNVCGYLTNADKFIEEYTVAYIEAKWEDILYRIEKSKLICNEIERIEESGELEETKKLLMSVKMHFAPVNVTILKNGITYTFKMKKPERICANYTGITIDDMYGRDREIIETLYGCHAVVLYDDIIKITYGKNLLFERNISAN